MLQLKPAGVGPFVDAKAHGGVQGVVAAVQHFVARAALDPAVHVFAVDLGQHALLCGELLVPFARQLLAGVHIAGAGFVDGELAQQQVFGAIHAHQPELDAVRYLAAAVVDLLQAAGADDVAVVVVVALDGAQAGELPLRAAHPVVDGLGLVGRVDADGRQPQAAAVPGLHVALLQVLGDGLPVSLAGGVALNDVVGNGPTFQPAAPGPDGDLPAVALHVHPGGEQ